MKGIPRSVSVTTVQENASGIFDLAHILPINKDQEILLLESSDIVTKRGQKSMLFLDLALRAEAFANHITIKALMSEAEPLIKICKAHFAKEVIEFTNDSLTLAIEPLYRHVDVLEKMRSRSALDVLRAFLLSLAPEDLSQRKHVMITGLFSYDFLDHFENLPKPKSDKLNFPDYIFYLPLTMVMIDHKAKKTSVISHALSLSKNDQASRARAKKRLSNTFELIEAVKAPTDKKSFDFSNNTGPLSYQADIPDHDFYGLVEKCKEHINVGDVYQIVPSRTFSCEVKDPISSYQVLRQLNPSPYMFFVRTKDWTLFGASPETFIKVDKEGQRVSIRPIAGTRRRGFDQHGAIDDELDSREQASLCLDEKELAEHMMLVDLARNDIASVCRPYSRRIKRLLQVDRFSHVMHLVSEVEGRLLKEFDALSAYQASMNMGTLMGAPKVRAAELLRELELTKRGFYGGAIGYVDLLGNMDTAIIIRSALVKKNIAYVRAGCGVVFDSTPQFETQETVNKAEAVLRSIAWAGTL